MQSFGSDQSKTKLCGLNLHAGKAVLQLGTPSLALAIIARKFEMTKKLVDMGFDINKPQKEVLPNSFNE